ncbi:tyrosine-type recombinase/integrase [Falsiroseomonas oryzae]|uniref:tyrosine-type recombinase/integrase n=1 Tax=Falsiroseomonas oryzae TaxID=2766473 RepID=UPI0022EA7B72|nr:site-specific integrase [Roseomonas sp. MO-31]
MGKLSAVTVKALRHNPAKGKRPVRFGDGEGLYLQVAAGDTKSWLFRYTLHGKAREMGLGWVALTSKDEEAGGVSLARARDLAREARAVLQQGRDPIAEREARREAVKRETAQAAAQTFEAAARALVDNKRSGWRSAKHAAQWLATLEQHAFPIIGKKPVAKIGTDDVLDVLRPIWDQIPETASRVRQRIEAVLDDARVKGWRSETPANPARWRGHLSATLPPPRRVRAVKHFPSLPWQQMGAFMGALSDHKGMAAKALRFAILTGSRTGAVRLMRWREIDLEARIWTAPAANMKTKKPHRTPLPPAALALVESVKDLAKKPDDLVFPGARKGRPLSDMALSMLVRGMACDGLAEHEPPRWRDIEGRAVVPHGFRATFKGWSLAAGYPDPLSELALAHTDKDKVRAAYAREDMLEQRRPMMDAWAEHCAKVPAAPVSLAAARARRTAGKGG